jgi:hypothetical protein
VAVVEVLRPAAHRLVHGADCRHATAARRPVV